MHKRTGKYNIVSDHETATAQNREALGKKILSNLLILCLPDFHTNSIIAQEEINYLNKSKEGLVSVASETIVSAHK